MKFKSNEIHIGGQANMVTQSNDSLDKYRSQLNYLRDSFADGSVFNDLRLFVLIAIQRYSELKQLPKNKAASRLLSSYGQLLEHLSDYASTSLLQIIDKAIQTTSPLN